MDNTPEPKQVCDDFADGVGDLYLRVHAKPNDLAYVFPKHQANEKAIFLVNSRKLASTSTVFRDMLAIGQEVDDEVIDLEEHPALVRTLLRFIFMPVEAIHELPSFPLQAYFDCWNMFDKYDMIYLQSLIEQYLM